MAGDEGSADGGSRAVRRTRGFLFADLRAYTAFVEAHGDEAAAELLDAFRKLVRDVIRRFDGAEIRTEGDSFYVVFPSASEAVRCGLAIAAAADNQTATTPERPIKVGIGVHAGETTETSDGYVGSAVNLAARLCAQARPGEVLVSDTVRGLVRTSGELQFISRGRRRLKGISEPIAVYSAAPGGSLGRTPSIGITARLVRLEGLGQFDRRRLLAAGAVIAGTLAIALVAMWLSTGRAAKPLAPGSPGGPPSSQSVGVVPSRSSRAPLASPTVSATWSLLPPGPFAGARINGVGSSGDGFLAVGEKGNQGAPLVWDTPSGGAGAWGPVGPIKAFTGATLEDSANPSSSSRFAIVGEVCPSGPASCRAAAWSSGDPDTPLEWSRSSFAVGSDPAASQVVGVGVGGPGFIAVGSSGTGGARKALIWTSVDGTTWEPVTLTGDLLSPDIRDVASGSTGIVAVGSLGSDGAVWRSPDGHVWTVVATGAMFKGVSLSSVAATFDGFIAVGRRSSGASAWISTDGASWMVLPGLPHLGLATLTSVAARDPGAAVIVGSSPDGPVILYSPYLE